MFVFGLQHDQDLLQVVQIDLLRTVGGAHHGDDAFSDVGQIGSLRFLHVSGCRKKVERKTESWTRKERN